jgi:hypothetical protein
MQACTHSRTQACAYAHTHTRLCAAPARRQRCARGTPRWHTTDGLRVLHGANASLRQRDARTARGVCAGAAARQSVGGSADIACGGEALHHAAKRNNVRALEWLLDHGVPVGATDDDGATALHWAAGYAAVEAAAFLLKRGADVSVRDAHGRDVGFWAEHTDKRAAAVRPRVRMLRTMRRTIYKRPMRSVRRIACSTPGYSKYSVLRVLQVLQGTPSTPGYSRVLQVPGTLRLARLG